MADLIKDSIAYLDDQYARHAEFALLGVDTSVRQCQVLSERRWLIAQLVTNG